MQEKTKSNRQTPWSFLWSAIRPYKFFYLLMFLAPICSGIYPIVYNYAVKLLLDLFTQLDIINFKQAFWPIFWFLGAQIILDGGWRLHNFAQLKSIPYVFQNMMDKICHQVFYLSHTYFQDNLSGTVVSKIKGIGDNYYAMHQDLEFKLTKPVLITIFSGVSLALVNYKIFLFAASFIAVYGILAVKFFPKLANMEKAKQDALYHLFGTIADRVQNITNIFAFATRKSEIRQIQDYYRDVLNPLSVKYYKYDFIICIFFSLLYWMFLISIFVFVIHLKNLKLITIGDIAFIISITFVFAENSWHTATAVKEFMENIAKFRAAFTLMQVPKCSIDDVPNATELQVTKGEIVWKNVNFSYDNKTVFADLNLHIRPGEKVGLVGHSGAGKSTLISLLLKNFKVTEGNIYIDNQSIYQVTSDSLRANIALIPQDIMLFHRSLAENIGYARNNATQEEIEQAAKIANIHDFIIDLPEGYNTLVGERGIKLSGGQRQRIAIARAILKNSAILILDEATSSLDSQTENEIQKSINTMLETNKATVIAIAHRLSTIKNMDRIVVFDNGKIVEDNSFMELVNVPNGKFKELWEHQVNGMVL